MDKGLCPLPLVSLTLLEPVLFGVVPPPYSRLNRGQGMG